MRKEDRLILAAFEGQAPDLSDLNDADRRQLDLLQGVKRDLGKLKEVPECQLTSERLKYAILNSRSKPAARAGKWLWAPPVAAVALALYVVAKTPTVVSNNAVADRSAPDVRIPIESAAEPSNGASAPASGAVAMADPEDYLSIDDVSTTASEEAPHGRSVRAARIPTPTNYGAVHAERPAMSAGRPARDTGYDGRAETTSDSTVSLGAAPSEVRESKDSEPVVVVSPAPNPDTGVSDALEVSRPKDVLFGG